MFDVLIVGGGFAGVGAAVAAVRAGELAGAFKRMINQQWIYPPVDDREAILGWGAEFVTAMTDPGR